MNRFRMFLLLCAVCFLAVGCGEETIVSEPERSEAVTESREESEPEISGYGLLIDGETVAWASDRGTLEALKDGALEAYLASFDPEMLMYGDFYSDVEILPCIFPASSLSTEEVLAAVPAKIRCMAAVEQDERYEIPFETHRIYEKRTKEDYILRDGRNGVGVIRHQVVFVGDEVQYMLFMSDETETEPVAEEILTGTPLPDGEITVSTLFSKPYDGRLSSTYGETVDRAHPHYGIDIIAFFGSQCYREPAYAAADGIVVQAGRNGGYGWFVLIDHGNDLFTAYGHFDSLLVEAGQTVTAGTPIGLIGQTGQATGPHLHFEVRIGSRKINPLLFLEYSRR